VLALEGFDDECLDAAEQETVTRRFEAALRVWDEHTHLYQYLLKRRCALEPVAPHPTPAVEALLRRRQAFLSARASDLYALTLSRLVLDESDRQTRERAAGLRRWGREPLATMREALSTAQTVMRLDGRIDHRRRQLRHKVDAFCAQLEETLQPRILA